jgi:hypothetical protein
VTFRTKVLQTRRDWVARAVGSYQGCPASIPGDACANRAGSSSHRAGFSPSASTFP